MGKVRKLVQEARRQGLDNLQVFITTNASLLDEEIMDWLMDAGWNVKLSFDGPASVHDAWRVLRGGGGTYERAVKALTYMVGKTPGRVTACAVLCRGTDPAEVVKVVEELGIQRLDMAPVAHTGEAVIPGPGDLEKYRTFIDGFASRFKDGESEPPVVISNFNQCMMRLMGYKKARMICTAGRFYLGVGPEGDLYPCGRFIGVDRYRLGHISSGLEPDARMAFLKDGARPYDRREPCGDCWAAPLCTGPCFAVAEMFGKGNGRPLDYQCAYILETARAAFSLYSDLKENNPEGLLAFLPTLHDEVFN
jgi:uncharacterized protein